MPVCFRSKSFLGAVAIAAMLTAALVARAFVGPGERIVLPTSLAIDAS